MNSSGLFINGLGQKKLDIICNNINLTDYFDNLIDKKQLYKQILNLSGFAEKTTEKFIEKIDEFADLYNSLLKNGYITRSKERSEIKSESKIVLVNEFNNKKIVLTGFRDKTIEDFITKSGGTCVNTMSKSVYLLIIKDDSYSNTKVDFALKNDINIISLEKFKKNI